MREYRDSGNACIGCIPQDWECVQIARVIEQNQNGIMVGPFGSSLTNAVVGPETGKYKIYGQANLIRRDFNYGDKYVTEAKYQELKTYEVIPGDIAVSMMGTIGKCRVVPEGIQSGIMDSHLIKLRLGNRVDPFFFEYMYESLAVYEQIMSRSKGSIMTGLNSSIVKSLYIALPPLDQQFAIVAYLDRKVSHIDSIIAEARASIEEYKAWKASIIYEAVTKGLDKGVEMKDSGVEWIGKTPRHWDACALKQLTTKIGSGKTPSGGAEVYSDTGVIFLRSQNIYNTGLVLDDVSHISADIDAEMKNTRVQYEDVLLNITGGSIGRCCLYDLVDTPANVNQHVCILRTDRAKLLPQFLRYFWNSASGPMVVDQYQTGGNRQGLNFEQIGMTKIPLCSIAEQQTIIDYLDKTARDIDSLISEKESLISDLEAYKKSLIFEVVTGKRKVI